MTSFQSDQVNPLGGSGTDVSMLSGQVIGLWNPRRPLLRGGCNSSRLPPFEQTGSLMSNTDHDASAEGFQALLIVSFGGPEQPSDVRPFLENVTRGRGVPPERLAEVEQNYLAFGGRSPINDQVRALIEAVRAELDRRGHTGLPIYWGNRNWHPFLTDTLAQMAADGVGRAAAFVTSAYSSYSGCRQYLEDIEQARRPLGVSAPEIDKLRVYFDHPGFLDPMVERTQQALSELDRRRPGAAAHLLFCAHSVPLSAANSCAYQGQLAAAAGIITSGLDQPVTSEIVFQSRSGPPQVPWLEPDVGERLTQLAAEGVRRVVLVPLGFISDHLEVVYDLDTVAIPRAAGLGIEAVRAATVGTDARFVALVVDLIEEREAARRHEADPTAPAPLRPARSSLGVWPDRCAADCCPAPSRRP